MGITLEEFENMNPRMIESYRKGFEQRQELEDEKMWNWFGTYGISAVMVAMEHALFGKDAKSEYLKESITKMQRRENGELTEEEKKKELERYIMEREIRKANWRLAHQDGKGRN